MADTTDSILQGIYYSPKTGYSGAVELYRRAKQKSNAITLKAVKSFLERQKVVQVFKGANRKKEHQHIEAERGTWQIDHCFMKKSHRKINGGHHAIFVAIEIGSRYAFACAMKNIRQNAVIEAFEKLYEKTKKRIPVKKIVTDEGVEFGSGAVKEWLEEKDIKHRILEPTYHYHSNAIVERFNLTLKQKLQKYMVANETKKWVDALPDIVHAYNRSVHSFHGERPKDVVSNPATQLLHRIRTIQSNWDIRRKKRYILNRIRKGTQIRILRKTDEAFSKKIQKYGKTRHTVEGVVGGGTMVKVAGIDRQVRPWEVQVADIEETNPNPRAIISPDVETALSDARKARKEGHVSTKMARKDPILKDAKKQKQVSQSMVGRWLRSKDGFEGTVVRATKTGMWLETVSNGKKSEMLIRAGEPYNELTSPPKNHDDRPQANISKNRMALIGMKFTMNDDEYSVVTVDQLRCLMTDSRKNVLSIPLRDDPEDDEKVLIKQLRLCLFVKTFDWKSHAIPIRTEDGEEPFWIGKPLSKPKHATADDAKRSGGEVEAGWWVMPICWYDSAKGTPSTYNLTNMKHLLNLQHTLFVPHSIDLVPDNQTKARKATTCFTLKADDRQMLMNYLKDDRSD